MKNFGEELRMERLSRGIALSEITAVTKISSRHLEALEQGNFRQLPGGILSKGIVRGYASAVGLDQQDWTERFLEASGEGSQKKGRRARLGRVRLECRQGAHPTKQCHGAADAVDRCNPADFGGGRRRVSWLALLRPARRLVAKPSAYQAGFSLFRWRAIKASPSANLEN